MDIIAWLNNKQRSGRALCKYLKEIDTHDKEKRLLYRKLGRNTIAGNGMALKKGKLKLITKEKISFWQWLVYSLISREVCSYACYI